jgi:hypothetical protein
MRWQRVWSRVMAAAADHRLLLAAGAIVLARGALYLLRPDRPTDFDQLWWAAGALLAGDDPYAAIARGAPYPLYYPLPAVLVALPLALLPLAAARVIWDVLVGWIFAAALGRRGPVGLLALGSGAYLQAMVRGQVTPLLVAAVLVPSLGWLFAFKPNIGLALWAGYPTRRAAVLVAAAVAVSLVVMPTWPLAMWQALAINSGHIRAPISMPFGWVLLAALLRWRRPEGRLLAALAVIPQHLQPYETLVLCLLPRTAREMGLFVAGTWVALIPLIGRADAGAPDLVELGRVVWPWLLACVYLPALYLVLRGSGAPRHESAGARGPLP